MTQPRLSDVNSSRNAKRVSLLGRAIITFAILFALFFAFRVVQAVLYLKNHPVQSKPGESELDDAVRAIGTSREGLAHGNSPEARKLAEAMSKLTKATREILFTKIERTTALSELDGKDFVVYCQLNEDSCAFLIKVPDMRKFDESAGKMLCELAYVNAGALIKSEGNKNIRKLAVATRGVLLFDRVLIGDYKFGEDNLPEQAQVVAESAMIVQRLYAFFASKPSQSATVVDPAAKK